MSHPFIVNTGAIRGRVGNREEVVRSCLLDELRGSGSAVPDGCEVSFTGHIETIDGGVVTEGVVRTSWAGECRRCLGRAEGPIEVSVREVFEQNPTEGETYLLERDHIDLEPLVREAVMLELPIAPLCKDDCAGLCPQCGINLNESSCDCAKDVIDPRWAALDELKRANTDESDSTFD